MGDVGDALARVEQIPLDRVARQIANRAIAVRFDRPLDPLPDRARRDAGVDRFDRGLEREFRSTNEFRPVPRADLHGNGGVRDPAVQLGSQVKFDHVPVAEPQGVVVRRRIVGGDMVDRDARRESRLRTPLPHEVFDFLRDVEQQRAFLDQRDRTFPRLPRNPTCTQQ